MELTLLGITIFLTPDFPKHHSPILVKHEPGSNVTSWSSVQLLNALLPIVYTFLGIMIFLSFDPLKQRLLIVFIREPGSKMTSRNCLHL